MADLKVKELIELSGDMYIRIRDFDTVGADGSLTVLWEGWIDDYMKKDDKPYGEHTIKQVQSRGTEDREHCSPTGDYTTTHNIMNVMVDTGRVQKEEAVQPDTKRAMELLKAAQDLLSKQKDSGYVLNILETTVHYDDCDCDGYCLLDDIESFIEYGA